MDYYVKELACGRAVLMAADGHRLAEFASSRLAEEACRRHCLVAPLRVERHYSYLQAAPADFESSFLPVTH